MILIDTHIWIWFHFGSTELKSEAARTLTDLGPDALVSTVSIWETMLAMQKDRVRVLLPPEQVVRIWLDAGPFTVVPLMADDAIAARTLPFGHDDPGDRFLAATAINRGVPLMTSDARLLALDWLPTIGV